MQTFLSFEKKVIIKKYVYSHIDVQIDHITASFVVAFVKVQGQVMYANIDNQISQVCN